MRIVANESSYDAKAVRRVLTAVYPGVPPLTPIPVGWWDRLRVRLQDGRGRGVRAEWDRDAERAKTELHRPVLVLHLPALRGTEFIGLARQQHGGDIGADHGGLKVRDLAICVQAGLLEMLGARAPAWTSRVLAAPAEKKIRRIKLVLIPLRILKPKPPRDRIQDRYAHVLKAEKMWKRKQKLAGTKIKKLRQRRIYYEKLIARRHQEVT